MTRPHYVIQLDDCNGPTDVLDVMVLEPYVRGDLRWSRALRLNRVHPDASLLPPGVTASHVAVTADQRSHAASGPGWLLRVRAWNDGTVDLIVVASDERLGNSIIDAVTAGATPEPVDDPASVAMGFWHAMPRGFDRRVRTIAAPAWEEIARNYTAPAATALGRLMASAVDELHGRLVLLHGPPGTGKTTALRSLARAWRHWCAFDYVIDPERLLGDPGYLMSVALGDDDTEVGEHLPRRWRLLVMEDCDEVLRPTAKADTGQALARLLNITDGLLGQGVNLLVAITTNEPLSRLHPAVVRPGRCLAEIEVGPLRRDEALRWLRRPASIGAEGATLAELVAYADGCRPATGRAERTAGMYL